MLNIFNSIIEADARYNFNNDDLVIVMWTCKEREDRYSNNNWIHDTNRSQITTYGKEWVRKFGTDTRGFLIRDLAYIAGTQLVIQKANWEQFCLNPLTNIDTEKLLANGINTRVFSDEYIRNYWLKIFDNLCEGKDIDQYIEHRDVINIYKDLFLNINKSFESRWTYEYAKLRSGHDLHPTPKEALEFIDSVWPTNSISTTARNYIEQQYVNTPLVTRL